MTSTTESVTPGTRAYCTKRWGQLKTARDPWIAEYKNLSRFISPRRGMFYLDDKFTKHNRTTDIIDATARFSLRTATSGMLVGNMSPSRPWFKLGLHDSDAQEFGPIKIWLAQVQRAMLDMFRRTNLYGAASKIFEEELLFGTGGGIILDDPDTFMRVYPWTAGTYCIDVDHRGIVDTAYRETTITALQMARQFGLENMSGAAKNLLNSNPGASIPIMMAIEPRENVDLRSLSALQMPWSSVWFESGANQDKFLRQSGFKMFPGLFPRWDITDADAYGSGPGIDCLGDNMQLQFTQKAKAKNVDKMSDPPLVGPSSLRNKPVSQMPGDITFYETSSNGVKLQPLFEVNPNAISVLREDVQEIQERIRKGFYVDTFLMLSSGEYGKNMTAREIDELHSEKLVELGPVSERQQTDMQVPVIQIGFQKMLDQSRPIWQGIIQGTPMLPPPPKEMAGQDIKIEFISLMAQAQKSVGMSAIETVVSFAGNVAKETGDQSVMDNINLDNVMTEYADMAGPPPVIMNDPDQRQAIRDQRQQQQNAQTATAAATPLTQSLKNLGSVKTDEANAVTGILGGKQS